MKVKTMPQHPQAEILRALADSLPIQKKLVGAGNAWLDADNRSILANLYADPDGWEFRVKPTPMCSLGGIEFPLPRDQAPMHDELYWLPNPADPERPKAFSWKNYKLDQDWLACGLCQATEEGGKLQGRAMAAALQQAIEGAK